MPALLRAKVTATDKVAVQKTIGMKTGFMTLSDFEQELGNAVSKVFPSEATAKSYAQGEEVIKVDVIRKFD